MAQTAKSVCIHCGTLVRLGRRGITYHWRHARAVPRCPGAEPTPGVAL